MVTEDVLVDDDFEAAAKQSWQSFSTMKRFVCEANRLENASWRLWFMQKHQNSRIRKSKSTGSLVAYGKAHASTTPMPPPQAATASSNPPPPQPHPLDSRSSSTTSTLDVDIDASLPTCVYCELHTAHLSCNGCCHDVYCVSCFKLVHKKGTLATHTAVKIKDLLLRRSMEQLLEETEAESTMSVSSEGQPDVEPTEASTTTATLSTPSAAASTTTTTKAPALASRPSTPQQPQPRLVNKTKPWEIQMDMLIQRLMVNSMHTDGDISVHNIDRRDSLVDTAESIASSSRSNSCADSSSDNDAVRPAAVIATEAAEAAAAPPAIAAPSTADAIEQANQAVVAAAVLVAGRHQQKRTLSFDGLLPLSTSSSPPTPSIKRSGSSRTATAMRARSPSASAGTVATTTASGVGAAMPVSALFAELPRTKSKKKNSVCQNCSGNHITIDCPLLASTGLPATPAGTTTTAGSSVDTVLRKCFTTLHNDNLSNSTHAFLGDEISVRGGGHFSKTQWQQSSSSTPMSLPPSLLSTGMGSISEDALVEADDVSAVLLPLNAAAAAASANTNDRKWDCTAWLVSSLATELPQRAFEAVRTATQTCTIEPPTPLEAPLLQRHAYAGWVLLKDAGQQHWRRRFLSLYRNCLWEFLDDTATSRPVGYANVSEGAVHVLQQPSNGNAHCELALQYYRQSSPLSARNECALQLESAVVAAAWLEHLAVATRLQVDDLFDLAPDAEHASSSTPTTPECYELGKGRFSVVRRARRKHSEVASPVSTLTASSSPTSPSLSHMHNDNNKSNSNLNCALKIIDKNVFWDLVAHETEREDTVVREILTQSLLTVRAGASYCPVIRLLSLFETRNVLVLELELMHEGDLHEAIATHSAVDEHRAPYLVASLVKAIAYCQQQGVAHRDVKLSNLALDFVTCPKGKRYSVLKMADFGMAAFIQPDGRLSGRCGTPGFVAPEILTAGKGASYPSGVDMFSAGVVAYTMLCGYEPFFGVNDDELIQMNKSVEYEFEEPEWTSISDEAKDLITLMMEKDTTRRITPSEALAHPYLRDASARLDAIFSNTTAASAVPPECAIRLL